MDLNFLPFIVIFTGKKFERGCSWPLKRRVFGFWGMEYLFGVKHDPSFIISQFSAVLSTLSEVYFIIELHLFTVRNGYNRCLSQTATKIPQEHISLPRCPLADYSLRKVLGCHKYCRRENLIQVCLSVRISRFFCWTKFYGKSCLIDKLNE